MKEPSRQARKAAMDINRDAKICFTIPGTRNSIKFCPYVKPYTIERLTELWSEIEETQIAHNSPETLKYAVQHTLKPYQEAALYVLNSYWKIRLFYRLLVFWWAYIKEYSQEQMNAIIKEGKKKIVMTLTSYYENMALTMDMRADWMKMTQKEAEQFRVELLSAAEQLSSKNTKNSEGQEDFYSVS